MARKVTVAQQICDELLKQILKNYQLDEILALFASYIDELAVIDPKLRLGRIDWGQTDSGCLELKLKGKRVYDLRLSLLGEWDHHWYLTTDIRPENLSRRFGETEERLRANHWQILYAIGPEGEPPLLCARKQLGKGYAELLID